MRFHINFRNINPEKGYRYVLTIYALQTGTTDQRSLLAKIASHEADALLTVLALKNARRYEEAADLLTFYFQANPSLMEWKDWGKGIPQCPGCLMAADLKGDGADSAEKYMEQRRIEEQWTRRIVRFLAIAGPIVVTGAALIEHDYEQRERERKKAEEEAQKRQKAHDAENARRRAQGSPSLEEEENRAAQRRAIERENVRKRCLEICETNYHSCLAIADPRCCGDGAPYFICLSRHCKTLCEDGMASCRSQCSE